MQVYLQLLFVNEGRGEHAGTLTLVDRKPPYKVECLLNNLYGRRFNSPNDLSVHPKSGAVFFTDPTYAFNQDFAPSPAVSTVAPLSTSGRDDLNGSQCHRTRRSPTRSIASVLTLVI